jgi:hypothetical protein
MTKSEFKSALNNYKTLKDFIINIANKKGDGWDCVDFSIQSGKIWAKMWSGEDGSMMGEEEVFQEKDITKEVLAELMPDDLIF